MSVRLDAASTTLKHMSIRLTKLATYRACFGGVFSFNGLGFVASFD
jgi:hypothetical protein